MGEKGVSHQYLQDFEACRIQAGSFHHKDHIYLAWLYLKELPFTDVLARYPESIRRYAEHAGAEDLYHETITFAYLFLINERMECSPAENWESFVRKNSDLFETDLGAIRKYYSDGRLSSDLAKRAFVLPDRVP